MKWHSLPMDSLASVITKGTTPTSLGLSFTEMGVPFVRAQNLINGEVRLSADTLYIDEKTHEHLKRSQIQFGDLLLSIAGTIGRTAVVDIESSLNCNQAVAIIRLNDKAHLRYVRHWLATSEAKHQMTSKGVTGTITNLSLGQIKSLQVPVPAIGEQKRIAKILDAAEALRAQRRESITQLETLLQSTFLEMFGDPVTNPKGWEVV